jgi:mannose-6-phosphate isomerase-like protein (cupin superfamily)
MLQMPGGILMSRLKVYDSAAPDGQRGGTPHVHLVCTELYLVLAGSGAVEMIDASGVTRAELAAGDALVFSPGTVHRLINPNGDLDILVLMQNSGLPERGDNVVCFPDDRLADDATYAAAMRVTTLDEAYRRRDLGVEGFCALASAFATSEAAGRAALRRFYALAEARTQTRRDDWAALVESGPGEALAVSRAALAHLSQQDTAYLMAAEHRLLRPGQTALGFCGHLNRYFDPATLALEGITSS